jgi:hypothetical protein
VVLDTNVSRQVTRPRALPRRVWGDGEMILSRTRVLANVHASGASEGNALRVGVRMTDAAHGANVQAVMPAVWVETIPTTAGNRNRPSDAYALLNAPSNFESMLMVQRVAPENRELSLSHWAAVTSATARILSIETDVFRLALKA